MEEEQDAGVAQLREVFDACDVERTGRLGARGLELLCQRLQLSHRSPMLVRHLLGAPGGGRDAAHSGTVSFDEFKDGFISLLTQAEEEALSNLSAPTTYVAVDVDDEMNGNSPDVARKAREVSPKYVLGEKKYGRRSRPASQADVDVEISSEEEFDGDDVLLSGASDGNGSTATTREASEEPGSKVKAASVSDGSGLEILAGAVPAVEHSTADVEGGDFGTACLPVPASDFVSDSGFRTPDESGKETPPPPAASFNATLELGSAPSPGQLGSVAVFGGGGSESAESSLTLLETNPEEYLRATWRKLNVGRNGYLQVQELAGVCEHIGMEMDEEMICQLFHTLDSDQDGKISFEEFLQGMFQHGRAPSSRGVSPPPPSAATPSSLPPDPSPPHMTALPSSRPVKDAGEDIAGHYRPHHTYRRGRSATGFSKDASAADDAMPEQPVTGAAAPVWESGIFSSIDPDNSGYAESQAVVAFWESMGLSGGSRILKQLGFNPNMRVNLRDLTAQLEEELSPTAFTGSVYDFALASYEHELQHLKLNFEQAREERDRLRVNVSEANTRAALLAQEVDEHHAKLEKACERKLANLEKRHQEQLRELQEQLEREREAATAQLARLNQRSHEEMATLRNEEARLRAQCIALQQDNGRLELELQEFSERYSELHRFGESQQKELEGVAHLKQRVADLESGQAFLNDEHCQKIFHELESTQKQNKELKDCNDELSLELETLRQQLAASSRSAHSKRHRRSGSWVADYSRPGAAGGGLKRRGSEASSSEESDDDNPVAEKIRRRTGFPVSGAPEDAHRLPWDVDDLTEAQREVLDRLRGRFEQALRESDDRWRSRVHELESQLSSQPEVDKDSIDGAQSTIAKLQDELSMRNVLAERLRADVTSLQNQMVQQREQSQAQLALREQELGLLGEQRRALEDQLSRLKEREAEKRPSEESAHDGTVRGLEMDRRSICLELEATRKEVERLRGLLGNASPEDSLVKKEQQSLQAMYETKLAEVRNQVEQDLVRKVRTDVERELQTSLERNLKLQPSWRDRDDLARKPQQDLTAQLTEDICVLLRGCLRCSGAALNPKDAGDGDGAVVVGSQGTASMPLMPGHATSLQDKLAELIGKTLAAIESHLETLHLHEQERLRKTWEDQLRRMKQDHMMERLESELQHKDEVAKLKQRQASSGPLVAEPTGVVPSKTDSLLRDLYVENARLLRSLQWAEDGRRRAEHNSARLQYKCRVLSKLLTDVTRAAVDGNSRVACA